MLRLRQLLPSYFPDSRKEASAIWGKDVVIHQGDLVQVTAPSGSGKTSLVHFIYGLRRDYGGCIEVREQRVDRFSTEEIAGYRKQSVSIVYQDLRLFADRTAFQNIDIKRELNPFHPRQKITEMAQRLGIENQLNAPVRLCSFGEQQRIAVIRALMQPFDFLLLDEPFSHLDRVNSRKAMELIVEEAQLRKAAIVLVDLERVDAFPSTRILHL